jgi:hypothetical protein
MNPKIQPTILSVARQACDRRRLTRGLALLAGLTLLTGAAPGLTAAEETSAVEVKRATVNGELDGDKARLVIQAELGGLGAAARPALYGAIFEHRVTVTRDEARHEVAVKVEALQGDLRELVFALGGDGEVRQVTGEGLADWSVRQAGTARFLVLRLQRGEKPVKTFAGQIMAVTPVKDLPATVRPLTFTTESALLASGFIRVDAPAELAVEAGAVTGLVPVETTFLPDNLKPADPKTAAQTLAFRFQGAPHALTLAVSVADPEARLVVLRDFRLAGRLQDERASFRLTATARVRNPKGGQVELLRGGAALSALQPVEGARLLFRDGTYVAEFERAGEFPLTLEFDAAVRLTNGWREVDFRVAPAAALPVTLEGLPADTQFRFAGAARPERRGGAFVSHLPPDGQVRLAWKEGRPEAEGRLFYAAEALTQVAVSPGLMRQAVVLDFRVMQGELSRLTLILHGEAEVTRVQGPAVLAWNVTPPDGEGGRRLEVRLNAAQKDTFSLAVQMQQPLGVFPQALAATRLEPDGATRFGGFVRVVNQGAVRLEVLEADGLSQISPEQIPATDAARALLPAQATQVFAYRFSGAGHRLRLQADNILPELAVSELLAYHLGETELMIEAEFEVDVREAPLRELRVRIPAGFTLAVLQAAGMNEYFVTPLDDRSASQVRIVFGAPVSGRQLVTLRLERNEAFREPGWALPRLEVLSAKSTRGHVGVSADAGFRLTPAVTQGLTELATAFFPRQRPGLQAAFRISEPAWTATLGVERLPQTVQVDAFHLFSVGEGIAYGSSVLNYLVSGAPVSVLRLELSDEYANVEFTGKNVRGWQKTTNGFQVELSQPVAGTYTLLATYERPFKRQGEQFAFTGARPLEVQSEQGYTVVVSTYQFQVRPVNVSASLTALEPGEVPPEYRLFFDAPILAAYRYNARPFNLALALQPFAQGEMLSQVVDRAALTTRISGEGQVVTEARYFVKNKGTPHLRLILPAGAALWSVMVNSNAVVPVQDDRANLIPLPQHSDPNTLNEVIVKLAATAARPRRLTLETPAVAAPVLLADWRLIPDNDRRLDFRGGTLTPTAPAAAPTGFTALTQLLSGPRSMQARIALFAALGFSFIAVLLGRSLAAATGGRFPLGRMGNGVLALVTLGLAVACLLQAIQWSRETTVADPGMRFVAPVQPPESVLRVDVANLPVPTPVWARVLAFWPALLALVAWGAGLATTQPRARAFWRALGWTALAWAALRQPDGLGLFAGVTCLFLAVQVLIPVLRWWWSAPPAASSPAPSTAVSLLLLAGSALGAGGPLAWPARAAAPATTPVMAASVDQEARVEDDFVFGAARIRWQATAGQTLPVLTDAGVLTGVEAPADAVRLVPVVEQDRRQQVLVAARDGWVEATLRYQTRVTAGPENRGFRLPVPPGLVNRLTLTVAGLDVDVVSPHAVSVQREPAGQASNTVVTLVLRVAREAWIGWQPRQRDTRREAAVFYAEWAQVYVPGGGVVEGLHTAQLRPAQGELAELVFDVPAPAAITDVVAPGLSVWRFDPDTRQLRVKLSPAQARPFAVLIKSQTAAGPLPSQTSVGLVRVRGAAGEVGQVGVATGGEVQLDDVDAGPLAAINLEDFPAAALEPLSAQVPGLAVRRAFRYSNPDAVLRLKTSPVEPEVRVESQQTLSLGEDRVLLAVALEVEITRAGVFKLSFPLPATMEVESLSGGALSHWTELKTPDARVVTLHLRGRTLGRQQFNLTLAGPGARAARGWAVPQLTLREAAKQRGQLLVVPEQGLRLQVTDREGVVQFDPAQLGARQKGVLAFRLLQTPWRLALDLEPVDAWIQVASLQHVSVGDAQLKVLANLQYDIENTGVKSFRVRLPAAAENVQFRGDQVADFARSEAAAPATERDWEVKLHRRVIGRQLLQVSYTLPVPDTAGETEIVGVQAQDVNLQRGFLTVQAAGRLQARIENVPTALQPTEWQVIPRALQKDIAAAAANYTFRLIEPAVRLPVRLDRHQAASLLPARVSRVELMSVIADDGVMLTHTRVHLVPGDKRLLHLRLPREARFWFAFVNQNSVWPWNDGDQVLIPLEQHAGGNEALVVEFFHTSRPGRARAGSLDLALAGPRFDLPLENVTWQVYLSDRWRVDDWGGTLQLQETGLAPATAVDLQTYISQEAVLQREQTRQAEEFLSLGNRLLEQGNTRQARQAFKNAYGLSAHDSAFNEDARVQLQNLKMQQAVVGLNFRQARVTGQPVAPPAGAPGVELDYTQLQAKQIIERNTAEDNAVQLKLAERLIQQQEAAVASPAAIRASVPEQGRVLTFTRPLAVDTWADLKITLEATAAQRPASFFARLGLLIGLFIAGVVLLQLLQPRPRGEAEHRG